MSFHLLFAILFIGFMGMRIFFHRKAATTRGQVEFGEGAWNMVFRAIIGIGYISLVIVYIFYPALLNWASTLFPGWLRWIGMVITLVSVVLIWWVQWALGVQFNTTLHVRDGHQLVSRGPYRWVRHPMYTVLMLMGIGWLLLTANWFIGLGLIFGILFVIFTRVKKEEALLLQTLGSSYQFYMKRTGRFLPRIFNHKGE